MTPSTLLAAQTFSKLLTTGNALQQQISTVSAALNVDIPLITSEQVLLSSASVDLADLSLQLTYPRVCIYSSGTKNTQMEKFRSFSGTVSIIAEIWASANLLTQAEQWIHFYVDGVSEILRKNIGDWGNGMFFPGSYDVQFQPPKAGGLGYTESAKLSFNLSVSFN